LLETILSSLSNPVRARVRRHRTKDSVSRLAFRVSYLRRSREIYRRYLESKPWLTQLYTRFLNIRPGQRIVDVGCGPGDFSRHLARLSNQKAVVLGIDSNPKSIQAATVDTRKARLSRSISYKLGDVYKLPLEDGYADLTCCRTLLMHLTEPLKAVKEMARVTKPGGSVVALEGGKMGAFYDPDDEEYSRLAERAYEAWVEGIRKLEGKEFKIGEKLPGIFRNAGLSNVMAEVQADAWLYSDPRRRLADVKAELRFDYSVFKERRRKDRKYLLAGGMSNAQVTSYFNRLEARTKALMSDEGKLRNDASFYAATFFLVSGMKH
jgi:ubiquinone/menaquinone biosynthesis C-methylase UbiE